MNTNVIRNNFSRRQRWLARGAALLLAATVAGSFAGRANAGVFVSVNIAPPPLPVYVQPAIPAPGYIWTPGYWAWDGAEYYWVPGAWILPPYVGALWTPGYWGWSGGVYIFHIGCWGHHVGYYGGINYGFGYTGVGYSGGYWRGGGFYYNRSVNHITNNITHVYNQTVINNTINRTSFNGGPNGIAARATPQEMAWAREPHTAPVAAQVQQREMASRMPAMHATMNHGIPPIAATQRAGLFNGNVTAPMAARGMQHYTPQSNGALRSASFAPQGNAAGYRPANYGGYRQPQFRAQNYQAQTYRQPQYRSQGYQAQTYHPAQYRPQSYQAQTYRPAQGYARPTYQPAVRPALHEHTPPHGGGGAARGGDHDHH